jgi:hypothetical protein
MASTPKKKVIKKYILIILIVLCLVLIGLAFYFYHKAVLLKQSSSLSQQKEASALIAEVGRIILLPANETPTIATVSDPSLLKDQSFFADATKGDKVLIYTNARRAILYDPIQKKIINVASIAIGATNPSSLPSATTLGTTQNP